MHLWNTSKIKRITFKINISSIIFLSFFLFQYSLENFKFPYYTCKERKKKKQLELKKKKSFFESHYYFNTSNFLSIKNTFKYLNTRKHKKIFVKYYFVLLLMT